MQILFRSGKSINLAHLPLPQEVHIWSLSLDQLDLIGKFAEVLTPDETARAERFRFPNLKEKFILARGWLRTILGQYLGIPPREVSIAYEPGGKPYLSEGQFQFNLSHSGERALLAIALHRVGIDVEHRTERLNAEAIFERFFSPREQQAFLSVPREKRTDAFYRAWTRKEAILKAIGSGVQALEDCEIAFDEDEPPCLLRLGNDLQANEKWFLHSWDVGDGYEGAVAVEKIVPSSKFQVPS